MIFNKNVQALKKWSKEILSSLYIIDHTLSDKTKRKYAFTLAEILIVLLILGVIASLTIPSVTRKIRQAELKTALKKNYASIEQAVSMLAARNGGSFRNLCSNDNYDCFANLFKNVMPIVKSCKGGTGTLLGNCWHNDNEWKEIDGDTISGWDTGDPGAVLSNGALLDFWGYHRQCDNDYYESGPAGSFWICGGMEIDVNGFKPPNVIGEDIFRIYVQEDTIKPAGVIGTNDAVTGETCSTNSGWNCTVNVLKGK